MSRPTPDTYLFAMAALPGPANGTTSVRAKTWRINGVPSA
jgi:hypothetical protein